MKFEDFVQEVKERTARLCGPEYDVTLSRTLKNNSVKLTGLAILQKGSNITPTIYLEDFFTDFCDGMEMDEVIRRIIRAYEANRCPNDLDVSMFGDIEKVRDRIVYRVVNFEKNSELLQKVPHRRFLDLAVIYSISLGEIGAGYASVTVYHEHMAGWGMTEKDLWALAGTNTPRISGAKIVAMEDLIREMTGGQVPDQAMPRAGAPAMYVLTNERRINGAACLLYDRIIRDFAGLKKKDFYILPSSVHEVILLPAEEGLEPECLRRMVREVNETQVEEQEILSDSLYYYSCRDDELSIAGG